jgi:hypothetical protein
VRGSDNDKEQRHWPARQRPICGHNRKENHKNHGGKGDDLHPGLVTRVCLGNGVLCKRRDHPASDDCQQDDINIDAFAQDLLIAVTARQLAIFYGRSKRPPFVEVRPLPFGNSSRFLSEFADELG